MCLDAPLLTAAMALARLHPSTPPTLLAWERAVISLNGRAGKGYLLRPRLPRRSRAPLDGHDVQLTPLGVPPVVTGKGPPDERCPKNLT